MISTKYEPLFDKFVNLLNFGNSGKRFVTSVITLFSILIYKQLKWKNINDF